MANAKDTRNKNATAAERAAANRRPSGHSCDKCSEPILLDVLRMVKLVDYSGERRAISMHPYHIKCYTLI